MRILETAKFQKLRKKIKDEAEREALKSAVREVSEMPFAGKKLKGEFAGLNSFKYSVKGQPRRLIYRLEKDTIILFSFGPREGVYKK